MKTINKLMFTVLLLISVNCLGNEILEEGIWKGCQVEDTIGNIINYKRQDFIKIKNDSILMMQFKESISMETGEVSINITIDTLLISKEKNNIEVNNSDVKRINVISNTEFKIYYSQFTLTFKKIPNLDKVEVNTSEFSKFITEETFKKIEFNSGKRKRIDDLDYTFKSNGKIKYRGKKTKSEWESNFIIVEFENFLFLKGISSAPILITLFDKKKFEGVELDYRFDPKIVLFLKIRSSSRPTDN